MPQLLHHHACPASRFVRLVCGEYGIELDLVEERVWQRREAFLALNPAGTTPVFLDGAGPPVPGAAIIGEYLDETRGLAVSDRRLLPEDTASRVEVRRLVSWFVDKFSAEVSEPLVTEKIYKRFMTTAEGGGPPDTVAIRAGKSNIRYHLRYVGWLTRRRNWIAGDRLTYADLACAAQLSIIDYLGDVPWDEDEQAKIWYARVKSRPSFRPLLAERIPGIAPAPTYADLDF